MKMLTVHRPTEADRELIQWCVDGVLLVIPGICPWHERTTMVAVRDLNVSEGRNLYYQLNELAESGAR